jgi:hypothetical protein
MEEVVTIDAPTATVVIITEEKKDGNEFLCTEE